MWRGAAGERGRLRYAIRERELCLYASSICDVRSTCTRLLCMGAGEAVGPCPPCCLIRHGTGRIVSARPVACLHCA